MTSARRRQTSVVDQDLGTRFQSRNSGSQNLNRLVISPIVKNPAVEIDVSILEDLGCEEVMLHELDVRAFVLGFHVISYIDVLDDEFERGVGIRDG